MPRPADSFAAFAPPRHLPVELLRRYVAGELSAAEEHAVEAHTLDCAQCAEVLEGLEMQPAAVTDASLAELRQRLHTRVAELATETTPEPAAIPLWDWRPLVAAAVLLLSLGAVAWLVLWPTARPEIAARSVPAIENTRRATAPAANSDGASAPAISAAPAAPRPPDIVAVVPPPRPASRSYADLPLANGVRAADEKAQVLTEPAYADATVIRGNAEPAIVAAEVAPAADVAVATEPNPGQLAKTRSATETARVGRPAALANVAAGAPVAAEGRTIQGRILDTGGQPLPGATVLAPGTNTGVSTGADGRFALTLPPGSRQLAVSSIGYTTQTRLLRASDSTLTLALAPDTKQLSEVVVVRREAPPGLPSVGPLPAGGYAAYRQYLRDSLDYPEKAFDDHLQGTVRVQFVVGADGRLSDFKVVRKLSPECDEEALRLIKEGPAWFPGVQNNRRTARKVEINVPFSLEK